jgi:riboflavin synthase
MFTGLVTDKGKITKITGDEALRRFRVECGYAVSDIEMGASIMHSGVCLTVVEFGETESGGSWFDTEAIKETLDRSVLGSWEEGQLINLEQSLALGDKLGGHFVFGHVDALGEVVSITPESGSYRLRFQIPDSLAKYVAEKGSIAINGVSLTVAAVGGDDRKDWFEVAVIPHTWDVTTLGELKRGDPVNLEADMLARYVARMLGKE